MFRLFLYFFVFIDLLFSISLEDKQKIESTIFKSFTIETIQNLSRQANGNTKLEEEILFNFVKNLSRTLKYEIELVNSQDKLSFISNYLDFFREPKEIDVNKIRLKFQNYRFALDDTRIFYNFPNMFFLYRRLAQLTSENLFSGKYRYLRAGFYYKKSLQFRRLRMTLDDFIDPVRNSLQEQTEQNQEEAVFINQLLERQKKIKIRKNELKIFLKQNIVLKDQEIINREKIRKLEVNGRILLEEIKTEEKVYQEQLQRYQKYEAIWNQDSSMILLEIAGLFHKLESSVISNVVYPKENKIYPLKLYSIKEFKYAESVEEFPQYLNLLEKSFFLNEWNPEISYLIATIYRLKQSLDKTIYFYEEAIKRSEIKNNQFLILPEYIYESMWRLSNLYLQERQYTQSIYYYEKLLNQMEGVEAFSFVSKNMIYSQLLRLYVEHSGNYQRALELSLILEGILLKTPFKEMLSVKPNNAILAIQNYFWRALILEKDSGTREKSVANFYRCIDLYNQFEERKDLLLSFIKNAKEDLNRLREEKDSINIEGQQFVLKKEEEIVNIRDMLHELISLKEGLPLRQIFFGLSEQLLLLGRKEDAILVLEEAQKKSIHSNDAVQKIKALKFK